MQTMLKKLIFLLFVSVIIPDVSCAQVINVGKRQENAGVLFSKKSTPEKVETQRVVSSEKITSVDNNGAVVEELPQEDVVPPPPVAVTTEEIAELEIESKKSIRRSIKNKDDVDRERFLGVMNWAEKNMKMQELMAGGMSYKDAKKIVNETVKLPKINIKKDNDIEKYIYKKGNFITNEQ